MRQFLMPREHGAYAQLTFPILSGLILGRPGWAALAFASTTITLFLAYEPAVVLLGVRGVRLQREESTVARRQLATLVPLALLLGLLGLVMSAPFARLLTLVPAGLCALLIPLLPKRRVKTIAGETIVAAALASMHLPIAASGNLGGVRLWGPAVVWFAGFFAATLAVHAIKARQKQRDGWIVTTAVAIPLAALIVAVAMVVLLPALRVFAITLAVPLLAVLAVNAARVSAHALKRVGWTLVAADTVTLALFTLL